MTTLSTPRRALTRWLAVVLLVTGWIVPLAVPHTAGDDAFCAPLERRDDGDTPRVGIAGALSEQPDHCVVCHLICSFRSIPAARSRIGASLSAEKCINPLADLTRRAPAFDRLPARAPPRHAA